jgi:hypothetical protein
MPGQQREGVPLDLAAHEQHFREKARWCAQAGVNYWKVDWGSHLHSLDLRRRMTEIAREEAPDLTIEHARVMPQFNVNDDGPCRFAETGNVVDHALATLAFSDVFRSYDVTGELSAATTLDRLSVYFMQARIEPPAAGLVNCEDELYVGAALGCSVGIMRTPVRCELTDEKWPRIDEAIRAIRWQRIAPAFGVGEAAAEVSNETLSDAREMGDFWLASVANRTVEQTAPAVMSRGLPLPEVKADGGRPFVVASRNPNGAAAVATIPRWDGQRHVTPLVDVTLDVDGGDGPIGVFGRYRTLRLLLDAPLGDCRLWAQDLKGDEAVDVTDAVTRTEAGIELSGPLIDRVGTSSGREADPSDPGLVLSLRGS